MLNSLPHRAPFDTFANRADPDQAGLVRAASPGYTLFDYGNMIYIMFVILYMYVSI